MSDNVTKLHAANANRKRIVLLCVAAAVVLLTLTLILFAEALNLDAVGRWMRYGSDKNDEGYGHAAFDAHSSNRYALWEDGFAVASAGGLSTFREEGKTLTQQTASMSSPALQTGKDVILCYDIGGKSLLTMKDGRTITLEASAEGGFFDADISSGDTIATASSESGYKTVLRVYDNTQQEIYRWFSASQFMPVCAVSPNGKYLAAVAVGQKDGSFQSSVYIFRTDSEDVQTVTELGGGLIYDLYFVGDHKLCAVGEDAVTWLSTGGENLGSFDLTSWYLEGYDLSGDGFALLSLNMYKAGDRCFVESVDYDGNQLGSLFVGAEILDISACGKYAAILTTENLMICHKDLSEYVTEPNSWVATSVLMRSDGTAYLLTGNSASLYIP